MSAEDRLDDLAGSVSDGRSVDWDGAETRQQADKDLATVRAMKEVARIAAFSRDRQRSPIPLPLPESRIDPASEPERWGHLTLLETIGLGATGEVWRAWDTTLQREVALKFIQECAEDEDMSGALLAEARALARVKHPGVVAVYGIAEHDGRTGMWMELLRGPTLSEEIERRGGLPAQEVAKIGIELCAALEAVNRAGLIHRDLKPANVVLESDGRTVLTDFGLGWRRAFAGLPHSKGSGTPIFMSPGLLAGNDATARSDLYALGVTLWWALAGGPPFDAKSLEELKAQAARGPARSLRSIRPDAPAGLVEAIERAMATTEERPSSASDLSARIAASQKEEPRASRGKRSGVPLAIAAALLAVLAAGMWLVPRLTKSPAPVAERPATPVVGAGETSAAPSPYTVRATFVDRNQDGVRSLAPGDRVAPGDRLSLEFQATRPMWVYVLNEDERGEAYLLFPQPLFDLGNPVTPESMIVLPGTIGGRENAWMVTSRGGREHFLVVASPNPVPEIESELARLPLAKPGRPVQYAAIPPTIVERLRGVGAIAPVPQSEPKRAGTFDRFRSIAGRETVTEGIWARTIEFENPLR